MMKRSKTGPQFGPDDDRINPTAEDIGLADFLSEHADPTRKFYVRAFRVTKVHGKEQHSFLETWHDSVPEYEEIGEKYGPGTYRLGIRYTKPNGERTHTSRRIIIDPGWTGAPGMMAGRSAAPQQQAIGGPIGIGETMRLMQQGRQELMQMFEMLVRVMGKQGNGGDGKSPSFLQDLQRQIGETMVLNMEQQNKMINDLTRARLDLADNEPDGDGSGFVYQAVQWLMQAWEKYGTQILARPKDAGKLLRPQAQGLQQVEYALSHPEEYQLLYDRFQQQTGAPAAKLDEFIHELGYPTPAELRAAKEREASAEGQEESK